GRSTTERPDASARPSPHEWGRHCAGDPGPSKAGTAASRSRSFSHRARVVVSCAVRSHSRSSPVEVWCSGDRHCWSKTPLSLGGCIAGSEKSFSGVHERERSSTLGTGGEWTLGRRTVGVEGPGSVLVITGPVVVAAAGGDGMGSSSGGSSLGNPRPWRKLTWLLKVAKGWIERFRRYESWSYPEKHREFRIKGPQYLGEPRDVLLSGNTLGTIADPGDTAGAILVPLCVGRRRCGSPPPGEPILGTEEPHRHGGTNTMLEMLPGLTRIYEEWAEQYPDVQPLTIQFPPREKTS